MAGVQDAGAEGPAENPRDLAEQTCQTSRTSDFPPLNSVQFYKVGRGNEKRRHTNLLKKIVAHVNDGGVRSRVKVYRENLTEQLEECTRAHENYVNHPAMMLPRTKNKKDISPRLKKKPGKYTT